MGFLLPLMLLSRLESLAMFLDPWAMLQAFGAAFILHLPVAAVAAAVAALAAALLGRSRAGQALPAMILVAGFLFSAWMGARPWLDSQLSSQPSPWAIAASLAIAGAIIGFARPSLAGNAWPVARALAAAGAVVAVVALVAGVWPQAQPDRPPADPGRPDILIITMDALADAHLSSRGYDRPTTPELDAIAADALQFTHLVAASNYTTPTLNSLMTGHSVLAHGAWHLWSKPWPGLRDRALPARLHAMGYSVRAVSTNPNGGIYKNGYGRWFDSVATDALPLLAGCRDGFSRWLAEACAGADIGVVNPVVLRINYLLDETGWWERGRHADSRIGLAAADRLFRRDSDGRPIAVWVHLVPPHDPFIAPAPYAGRFDPSPAMRSFRTSTIPYQFAFAERSADHALFRARYDESIASVTAEVAAFVTRLRQEGRLGNTILMISADHGESFTPDYGGHGGPKLHDPLIRIPLILSAPGLPTGKRIAAPVAQIDLAPTLIALAGGVPPPDMEGRSLLPVIDGSAPARPVFAWALEQASRSARPAIGSGAMIDGRWKYVHYWNQPDRPGYRDLNDGLFDLAADPGETRNLAAAAPRRAAAMRAEIRRRLAAHEPGGARP